MCVRLCVCVVFCVYVSVKRICVHVYVRACVCVHKGALRDENWNFFTTPISRNCSMVQSALVETPRTDIDF